MAQPKVAAWYCLPHSSPEHRTRQGIGNRIHRGISQDCFSLSQMIYISGTFRGRSGILYLQVTVFTSEFQFHAKMQIFTYILCWMLFRSTKEKSRLWEQIHVKTPAPPLKQHQHVVLLNHTCTWTNCLWWFCSCMLFRGVTTSCWCSQSLRSMQ